MEAEIRKWETLGDVDIGKKIKNLKKKLKQIDELEQKLKAGASPVSYTHLTLPTKA